MGSEGILMRQTTGELTSLDREGVGREVGVSSP